jgi:Spy/CpxP family protein refolding chaperone
MSMGRARFLWVAVTVLLAAGTSLLVLRLVDHPEHDERHHGHGSHSEADFHAWMHEQLSLTPAQHDALEPVETAFEKERLDLRNEISAAGRALADAVRQGKAESPEVEAALKRLNAAQAELQRATLDHFFAMKEHLDPAQAEKLLQWTHDSILPD